MTSIAAVPLQAITSHVEHMLRMWCHTVHAGQGRRKEGKGVWQNRQEAHPNVSTWIAFGTEAVTACTSNVCVQHASVPYSEQRKLAGTAIRSRLARRQSCKAGSSLGCSAVHQLAVHAAGAGRRWRQGRVVPIACAGSCLAAASPPECIAGAETPSSHHSLSASELASERGTLILVGRLLFCICQRCVRPCC
jgi:hypothetical protein